MDNGSNEGRTDDPKPAHRADGRPLRVGLLLDSFEQPAWVHRLIADLADSPFAELALVVLNDPAPAGKPSFRVKLSRYRAALLFQLYTRFDAWRFRSARDPFVASDIGPQVAGVPVVKVRPGMTRFCDYFADEDIERILSYQLDVAVRLGFRILKGRALDVARHGVWSYHHADNLVNRGGPAGFWEVAEDQPATGTVLQILTEDLDNGKVIYRSWSRTNRYSWRKNRNVFYWKSAAFVGRKIKDLAEEGAAGLADPCEDGFVPYSQRLYRQPTNREMLRIFPRIVGRYVHHKAAQLTSFEQWFLAYKLHKPTAGWPDGPSGDLHNFRLLIPPGDRFWADPFPVERGGRHYIFFEELLYRERKGRIAAVELNERGEPVEIGTVLETDHHLSFPNLLAWQDELYMIPEAVASGSVPLYRCTAFPNQWAHEANLLEGVAAADAVIHRFGDRWWLFVTIPAPGTKCWDGELHLYHAETPFGPWVPHRRNPVKSDVRSARSAGRIFTRGDRVFRPAQDCSGRYGAAIVINEVMRLTESEFEERTVAVLRPNWRPGLLGMHTINAAGQLTVVDAIRRRRKFP